MSFGSQIITLHICVPAYYLLSYNCQLAQYLTGKKMDRILDHLAASVNLVKTVEREKFDGSSLAANLSMYSLVSVLHGRHRLTHKIDQFFLQFRSTYNLQRTDAPYRSQDIV